MENPIRVLHIVPNMQFGGLETMIMNIYRNIDRSKVQFDFLVHYTGEYNYDKEIISLGGKIYRSNVRESGNIVKYIFYLNNLFTSHPEYQIIHSHMPSLAWIHLMVAKFKHVNTRILHSHNNQCEKH